MALLRLSSPQWRLQLDSVNILRDRLQALTQAGHLVDFWWVPGHQGIDGNELADVAAKEAAHDPVTTRELSWTGLRPTLTSLRHWYQQRICRQNQATIGTVLDPSTDTVIYTDLAWTRSLRSRREAALAAQFLTGHYPTGVYLAAHGFHSSDLCELCGCPDTRVHLLLSCAKFVWARSEVLTWMHADFARQGDPTHDRPPSWTWDFLTGSNQGRRWLARFLRLARSNFQTSALPRSPLST